MSFSRQALSELMKSNRKKLKLNPAFKERQILPFLSAVPIRANAGTKDGLKIIVSQRASAAPMWVTTE